MEAEWPILDRRLAKLAINSYEFGRVSAAREKTMLAALNKKAYVTDADGLIWPAKQDQSGWTDHRTAFASHDVKAQEDQPAGDREPDVCACRIGKGIGRR